MTSSMHEEDVTGTLASKYAELKKNDQDSKAAGVVLAAESLGELGAVNGEIVKDMADRQYLCEHPSGEIEYDNGAYYCGNCGGTVSQKEVLERLKSND